MVLRAVILWIHVLSGVVWVGVCASFIVAAAAMEGEPNELHSLATKVAPQINRICVPLAVSIPLTGIVNLFFAFRTYGAGLPTEFVGIIAAKLTLLAIMGFGLSAAFRVTPPVKALEGGSTINVRRIIACYGVIVAAGVAALVLGLWLAGIKST
jgi:hypothetical protein